MNVLARAHGTEEITFGGALDRQGQGSSGYPRAPHDIAGQKTQSIMEL